MYRIPSLRICITGECNLACQYCPIHGDNYLLKNSNITKEKYLQIIDKLHNRGVQAFSITGGEPLLNPDLTFSIIKHIQRYPDLNYVKLNTNGILVNKYLDEIVNLGFSEIKISLDTLNPKTFKYVSQKDHKFIDLIKLGIRSLVKNNIKVRLQTVCGKYNIDELKDIIRFCEEEKIDIKIFDLTYYKESKAKDKDFWKENYISPVEILKMLQKNYEEISMREAVGEYGHPMKIFKTKKGTNILFRDSSISSYYCDECKNCENYPCQDGLCNLTLTTDGRLKICRNDGINYGVSDLEIDRVLDMFKSSKKLFRGESDFNI